MSTLQWAMEASALRKREEDEHKERMETIRHVFKAATRQFEESTIALNGQWIGAPKKSDEPADEIGPARSPFLPLIMYTAPPEIVQHLLTQQSEDDLTTGALDSGQLDQLNEDLMRNLDKGDLEPLFHGVLSEDPFERWASPEVQAQLRAAGIDIVKEKK